jgi:hypothetical protein
MNYLSGFPEWVVAVIDHWHGWVSGGFLAFVLEVADKLWDWKISKRTFAVILGVGLLWSVFATWRDEHNNSTVLIQEKADAWSKYNQCDKERAIDDALTKQLTGQVGSQQVQLANQQDTFNRCVLTLQQVSIPERKKLRVKTMGAFSVTDPQGKDTLVWLVVGFTNKTIPSLHAKLTCTESFVFQKFDIVAGGPLPAPKVGFSRAQVSDKQVTIGLQSPLWNPESPLLFMLTTEGKTSKLGECAISLD